MNQMKASLRIALGAAVGVQVTLLAARLVLDARLLATTAAPEGGLPAVLADTLTIAVFPAVGLVILRRRPGNAVGWLFCVANIGWIVNTTVRSYVQLGVAAPGSVPAPETIVWLYTWPGFVSSALYVLLVLLFPDGRFLSERWRTVGRLTVALMAAAAVGSALAPGPVDPSLGVPMVNPLGIEGPFGGTLLYELATFGYPIAILLLIVSATSAVRRYRNASGVERLQLKWFASGLAAWALLLGVYLSVAFRYADWDFPLWARALELAAHLGAGVFPLAAGIAILRYRLYEIDRIISRTVSYAILTVLLVGVYVAGVLGLGTMVRAATAGGGGDFVVAASTLAVAAAFGPLRRRVQSLVDRRFNRARYDAQRTVEDFAQCLRDDVDLESLASALRLVVEETVHPRSVEFWLRDEAVRQAEVVVRTPPALEGTGR